MIGININNEWYTAFVPASINDWDNILSTYDREIGEIKFYLDGNLIS